MMDGESVAGGAVALNALVSVRRVVSKVIEVTVMAVVALLVLDVIWGCFSRYVLGDQSEWTEELARVLLVWSSLLASPLAFGLDGHLGLDYMTARLKGVAKLILEFIVLAVAVVFGAGMVYGGWYLVVETRNLEQMLASMPLPRWVVYLSLPASGLLFLLFALEKILAKLLTLRSGPCQGDEK